MMAELGEDTKVFVKSVLSQRRKVRLLAVGVAALVLAFALWMSGQFGPKQDPELTIMGPVYTPQAIAQQAVVADPNFATTKPSPAAAPKPAAPTTGTLTVAVGADVQVWVDGQTAGPHVRQAWPLAPGKHVVLMRKGRSSQIRRLLVSAGASYRVTFAMPQKAPNKHRKHHRRR